MSVVSHDDRPRQSFHSLLGRISHPALIVWATLLALAYLAVCFIGWGGWRGFFDEAARAVVSMLFVLLAALTPACGCNLSIGCELDNSNEWIFAPLLVAGLFMGLLSAYSDRNNWCTFGGWGVRAIGVIVFMAGSLLRIASIRGLGRRFTVWVAIQEDHELVTTGLFRFVRHPSYTGAILTLIGWALVFRSTIGLLLALAMILPLLSRIEAEERLLISRFAEYSNYRRRSWRLLPLVY